MSDLISLTDVTANQILVWSEIENAFVNVTPTQSILNIQAVSHQPLSPNNNVISSIEDNVIRTRGIVAGDNVTITQTSSDLIISVDVTQNTDAETLSGYTHLTFVKKSELNDLVDFSNIQSMLDVYSKEESHDQFMETNASNIPDLDNTYDIGSNGRRYADVYAKTFHGTATNALYAEKVTRNGANDYDVLTWLNDSWKPLPVGNFPLDNLSDIILDDVQDNDILAYDSNTNTWYNVDPATLLPTSNLSFSNTGSGEGVYNQSINNNVSFKSLEANDGVLITSDSSTIHFSIDDDYIDTIADNAISNATVVNLENIFNINTDNNNTMLVWEDGIIVNKPIPTGGGDGTIDTSNASPGQVLSFDGINLVFVDPYNPLDDIDTTNALDGYVLSYNGSGYELRELPDIPTNTDLLAGVDTSVANNGDVLVWNGSEYTLINMNTLDDIDTTNTSSGDVLIWNGSEFILSPSNDNDTLAALDTTGALDGYYVAYNGSTYELREIPTTGGEPNTDLLADVVTSNANSGDVLVWSGTQYTLSNITSLDDIDTASANNGDVLTYQNGSFTLSQISNSDSLGDIDTSGASDGDYVAYNTALGEYELRNIPVNTDLLSNVDTSAASSGDVLMWDGSNYTLNSNVVSLSLNDLNDVNIVSPQVDQVLTWNGTNFTLQTFSGGSGVTSLSELDDVDGTVTPNNGDILTYNSTKSQYEPLPFVGGTGGTKYEILRVNYNASNNFDSVEYLTDNLELVSVINSDLVLLEVKFSNYTFPPLSIGYWGYVYTENMYRFINITEGVSDMSISGVGVSGAPTLFDPNRAVKEYNMSVSVRTSETQSSASAGFPPEPTHAYVVFVMGD